MQPVNADYRPEKTDALALLYQGVLTGVVRIRAGRQPLTDLGLFRRRMKAAIKEIERDARSSGYEAYLVQDAEFAVVAFLDETILSSKDPKAEEWRKRPLNIELYGQAIAGDVFFDKLAEIELRSDCPELADLLEVYLLCLLLGFEGRYAPPLRGEAFRMMERLRYRIESIRGVDYALSPEMPLFAPPPPTNRNDKFDYRWLWLTPVCAILVFAVFKILLAWRLGQMEAIITR